MKFSWPILGHKNIVEYLQTSIVNDRVAHAYLFHGPKYIGKTTVARNFVASLLCLGGRRNPPFPPKADPPLEGFLPCSKCIHCEQFFKNIHPDVYRLKREEEKKNISIEQMRDLGQRLSMGSFLNSYKIAVIDDAHWLSLEAANSLLKTLEEPAPRTIIILLADTIDTLPETIISRSQVLKFLPVTQDEIFHYLIEEGASREQAQNLARLAQGKPGLALKFFREDGLWIDYQEKIKTLLEIIGADLGQRFKIVSNLVPQKIETIKTVSVLMEILDVWTSILRDLILIKRGLLHLITNFFAGKTLEDLSLKYGMAELMRIIQEIKNTRKYLIQNVNPKLVMENLVLAF